jgi:hypothetical protein
MSNTEQNFKDEFSLYTDDALRKIVYSSASEYESYVVSAAKVELQKRYDELLTANSEDFVTLNRIISGMNFDDISNALGGYIKKKSELSLYKKVFEKLFTLKFESDNQIALNVFKPDKKSDLLDAYGEIQPENEKVDVTFLTWSEWLNINIKKEDILRYGKEKILAISLIKMSANGFDENDTKQRLAEMENNFGSDCNDDYEDDDDKADYAEAEDDESEIAESSNQISNSLLAQGLLAHKASKMNKESMQVRPWVRYFARTIDYSCFAGIVYFSLMAISPQTFEIYKSVKYISLAAIVWIFIEAVLLSTVGTTLGKWVLRVSVRNNDGTKLKFSRSLLRSIFVWACGTGFGVAFLNIILSIISYEYLVRNEKT